MAATTLVRVRVAANIKSRAAETLASMGLTVSDAVRVFLKRSAMREARAMGNARSVRVDARSDELGIGAKR